MTNMDESFKDEMLRELGPRAIGWRIGASILSVTAWLAIGIVWLFFYAGDLSLWQNAALFIVSLVALAGVNAALWVSTGMKARSRLREEPVRGRSIASAAVGVSWLLGLALYLYYYAGSMTLYQNLGVVLLSFVLLAGANLVIHARSMTGCRC
jgi:hypothetical protein